MNERIEETPTLSSIKLANALDLNYLQHWLRSEFNKIIPIKYEVSNSKGILGSFKSIPSPKPSSWTKNPISWNKNGFAGGIKMKDPYTFTLRFFSVILKKFIVQNLNKSITGLHFYTSLCLLMILEVCWDVVSFGLKNEISTVYYSDSSNMRQILESNISKTAVIFERC